MRYFLVIWIFVIALSGMAQPNPQSKKVTEKFFPEPDMAINTPAFRKKKGYTSHEEMMAFLEELHKTHAELMKISTIGESQKGKSIPMVILNREKGETKKIRVWIQGGLHGNEMGSSESVLYLIDQLLNNDQYTHLLDRLTIALVPMANIDGYERVDRDAANGLDLNRDQTKLSAPESVCLKKAFNRFGAEVALDLHEYNPYRKHYTRLSTYGISSIYDAMILNSGNLNVPENLRIYTENRFAANARNVLDEHQLTHHDYMSTTEHKGEVQFNQGAVNPRSSATSYALTNCVSTLLEVRGIHLGKTSFKRRIQTAFLVSISYLQTAYDHMEEVKAEIKKASESREEAIVNSKREVHKQNILAIDLDKNEAITLEVTVRDALKSSPTLIRKRPQAYLIPAERKEILEKLGILGLDLSYLDNDTELEVESYEVKEYQRDPEKFEDIHIQIVTTDVTTEKINFPKGTAILWMDQPRANLAIEVLEPEAKNSFVTYEVISTEAGEKLPIYRYLKTDVPNHSKNQ